MPEIVRRRGRPAPAIDQRQIALREASNLMEKLTAMPWDEIDKAADKPFAEASQKELPKELDGAEIKVEVAAADGRTRRQTPRGFHPLARQGQPVGPARAVDRVEVSPMKRRAFTLIEMVVVITVSSALMGVAIVMLVALLKSEGSSRRHLEFCNILNRLDEQFRADVHAAAPGDAGRAGRCPRT